MKYYPLLQAQLGVFLESVKFQESTQYNLPILCVLDRSIDAGRLEDAFRRLIHCKAVLRSRFGYDENGGPRQWPDDEMPVGIVRRSCSHEEAMSYAKDGFVRPFNVLSGEPLFRVEILETEKDICLLTDFHHLVVDAYSYSRLLAKELNTFYSGVDKPVDMGYFEAAEAESALFETEDYRQAQEYFAEAFRGKDFVTLSTRSEETPGRMITASQSIAKDICDEWCRENKTEAYLLFQAAFSHVMGILSRQDEVAYCTAHHGRLNRQRMRATGMFVNNLAAFSQTAPDMTVRGLLDSLGEEMKQVYTHAVYPMTHLSAALGLAPKVSFNFRPVETEGRLDNTVFPSIELVRTVIHSDMNVHIELRGNDYVIFADSSEAMNPQSVLDTVVSSVRAAVINMMADPDRLLKEIPLVTAEESEEILSVSRGAELDYDSTKTWVDLFLAHAAGSPEAEAVVDEQGSWTYAQLDQQSNAVAAYLLDQGTADGSFVVVKTGRRKEYLAAILGVNKAGAAFVPVDPEYPKDRIDYIISDSGASVMLTEEVIGEAFSKYAGAGAVNRAKTDGSAYMIYTSGSTGKPKGVVQPHSSLRAFTAWRIHDLGIAPGEAYAQYTSFAFDASFDDTICPLSAGASVHILSDELRRDMDGMHQYFQEHQIVGLTLPTQMGMAMLNTYDSLPLHYLMMGGEKLLPVKKTNVKIINGYGPTEFTVCSSYHVVDQDKDTDIPIGRPVPNTWSLILDRNGNLLPCRATGEICLAGPQIARGYHNLPEMTKSRFTAVNGDLLGEGVRVYHTGDLGHYDENGELVYEGRIDFQVKLRGFRIEMGEVEQTASAYPGIGTVCAQVRGDQLCLYYTEKSPVDPDALKAFMGKTLTGYMIPSAYIRMDAMPLTPNGKIDLKALPEPVMKLDDIVPPSTKTEETLIAVFAPYIHAEQFGVCNDLVSLGLNSLNLIRVCADIKEKTGAQVRSADIMRDPTIRSIGRLIDGTGEEHPQISAHEAREYYPLSGNQRGVYIDWEMNRDTTQYNIPGLYTYDKETDPKALSDAIVRAVDAHPYLKTRLAEHNDQVMQQPHEDEKAEVTVVSLDHEPDSAFFQSRIRPFDLFNDRLYRFEIYVSPTKLYLFTDIHHIVYDGLSIAIFMEDVSRILKGEEPEGETLTAFDLALYEEEMQGGEAYQNAEKRYDLLLSESAALIYQDSSHPDKAGACRVVSRISGENLRRYCGAHGVTPNSFMQAAFAETMHRLTREENFVFLTVHHGRDASPAFEHAVGMFVRTIPLVCNVADKPHGDEKVSDFVRSIHAQLQESYAQDVYPYTAVVDRYKLRPEVMFVFQGGLEEQMGSELMELSLDAVKTPIDVTVYPDASSTDMLVTLEYDGNRYSSRDMDVLLEAFGNVVQGMLKAETIREVALLDEDSSRDMINGLCRGMDLDFDRSLTWLSMFRSHVLQHPDKLAVNDEQGSYTYKELDHASDSIAHYLIRNGVEPDSFVIIKMDRVKEFAAAVIGVQKAGACYVPIDPLYPEDRIHYMIEDSEAKVVLTEEVAADALAQYPDAESIDLAKPENLAYMIYTSGSTGRPKGAMIPHSALMNYLQFYVRRFGVTSEDRISHHITWSFDSHIRDFYPALASGAGLYIMPEAIRRDPEQIYAFLEKYDITGSAYATAMGQLMLSQYDLKQKFVSVGGEALRGVKPGKCKVFNVCGATEVTDVVVDYLLKEGVYYADTPIGKPLANCYAFILDKYGNLLPQGIPGEICYAGLNVGNGYWHMPEKTAQVFVPCPFVKGSTMYHTGDLGRYNEDGDVEYMGRLDFQVKLRGFRIELGEIESNAIHYDSMKMVAAAVKKDQLCLYYVASGEVDKDALRAFLSETLTEYMVPTVYIQLDSMPMTPSGKVNRRALPEPEMEAGVGYVAPEGEAECAVAAAMKKVLGMETEVGAEDNFFTLGGDSIKAIRLVSALRQAGVEVRVADVMREKTVRGIAGCTAAPESLISQEPFSGETENLRWFSAIEQLPVPNYYLQTVLLRCSKKLDTSVLQTAFDSITAQHDMLRAVVTKEDRLFVRDASARIEIEEYTVASAEQAGRICAAIKPAIDMAKALIRAAHIITPDEDYLFFAAHHLIVDGVSWRILLSDLDSAIAQLQEGREKVSLPAKTNTWDDFARGLHAYRDSYGLALEIPYWKNVQRSLEKLPMSDTMDFGRHFETIQLRLSAEEIRSFLLADKSSLSVDVNDTMLCAAAESFRKVFGNEAVSVQFEGHGREDIGQGLVTDRTIGWFTSVYPVVIEGLTGDTGRDLALVKEALHRVPNKGIGYDVLRRVDGKELVEFDTRRSAMMSFNYLGEMDAEEGGSLFTMVRDIDTGSDRAEENYFGPDIAIDSLIANGEFALTLQYNTAVYESDKAQRFAEGILEEMMTVRDYLNARKETILTPTDLGENEWSIDEFESVIGSFRERGEEIGRIYPLTPMQESMLLKHITDPESWAYRLASIWKLDVLPSEDSMRKVAETLSDRHEVLRTAIIYKHVSVSRQAITSRVIPVEYVDISAQEDKEAAVMKLREHILTDSFDLEERSLVQLTVAKTGENSCYLVVTTHHIIVDGWCMQIFLSELMQLISDETAGVHTLGDSAEIPGTYEKAVREILHKDKKAGLNYWKELLGDYETRAEIPSYGDIPEDEQSDIDECVLTLPCDVTESLKKLCQDEQATINNGVELLWGMVLADYTRTKDAVFAKVVSGRDSTKTDVNDVVGLFINSVPVRVSYDRETTARQMIRKLSDQAGATKEYDFCPLSDVQQQTSLGSRLLQSVIAYENYNSGNENSGLSDSLNIHPEPVLLKEENFDEVNVKAYEEESGQLSLSVTFNRQHYTKAEIDRVLELFGVLADGIVKKPDEPLSSLPRVSQDKIGDIAALSRGDDLSYDRTKTWVDFFMEKAKAHPDNVAVVDRSGHFTYGQLDEISECVAQYLCAKGVQVNDRVAVMMTRRKEFAAAVLGVNKAGAAYVPVDPEYPQDRISFMLEDCGAHVVLSDENIEEAMRGISSAPHVGSMAEPQTNAYMIYTSGSTGQPKGVLLKMRAVSACLAWNVPTFGLDETKRNLHHPSFSFDASTFDLFYPLAAGAQIHILGEEMRKDLDSMAAYIRENGITGMTMSTAIGMALLNQYDIGVEYIMLGGEKFMPVKKNSAVLYNGYGPTEFTVCSSYHVIDQDKDVDIPIGRPVPNSWSVICDSEGHLLPQGMAGELCLAGDQICEGYWNRPEQNQKAFAPLREALPGVDRVYHTGDLARYDERGELVYLGRIDSQVKLRGFRIELGEIENQASLYSDMKMVAAEVKGIQLCLYFTAEKKIDSESLKEFLSHSLTEYMVPTVYMQLEEMPLTPNGKINRKLLPEPVVERSSSYVKPEDGAESAIAEAMRKVLGTDEAIGANDSFFELGGDSIKAIRLASVLRSDGISVQVSDIMSRKTPHMIAQLAGQGVETVSQEPVSGEVSDTAIYRFFLDLDLPEPAYFNQSALFRCRGRVNEKYLQKAVDALVYQHDMLRAVIKEGKLYVQSPDTTIEVERMSIVAAQESEMTDAFTWFQSHIDPEKALIRVVLVQNEDADYVFMTAHHTIIDGVSWRILSVDLEDAYGQLAQGSEEIKLPSKTSTYQDFARAQADYRDSYVLSLEIPYWKKVQEDLLSLPSSEAKDYSRSFDMLKGGLGKSDTHSFLTADLSRKGLEVNDLLLAAVCRSYSETFGQDAVSVQMEGHGREEIGGGLVIDRTVGWFTSVYPMVFKGLGESAEEDLKSVKEVLRRVPNKGVGYNILRFMDGREDVTLSSDRVAKIGFNYMGEMDAEQAGDSFFKPTNELNTGFDFSQKNMFGPDFAINCSVKNGEFELSLIYNQGAVNKQEAGAFVKGILSQINDLVRLVQESKAQFVTPSDLGETEWSIEEFEAVREDFAEQDERMLRIYPLTPMQEGMLLKHISEPESFAYRLVSAFELDVLPTEAMLRNAIDRLAAKHEVLRTAIVYDGVKVPRQAVMERRLTLHMKDISKVKNQEAALARLRVNILKHDYDLQRKPLLQFTCAKKSENSCYLIFAAHHMIVDGWCIGLYMADFMRYLADEIAGRTRADLDYSASYGRYEAAVREILHKDKFAALDYWKGLLGDYETKAEIPSFGAVPARKQSREDVLSVTLSQDLTERLEALCREEQATISNAAEMLWGLTLSTFSRTKDVVFGKVVSGRDNTKTETGDVVGLFINTVPVRLRIGDDSTGRTLLKDLQKQAADTNAFDFCPLTDIQHVTDLGSDLFQSVMAFENYNSGAEGSQADDTGISFRPVIIKEESFNDLDVTAYIDGEHRLFFQLTFDKTRYLRSQIENALKVFEMLSEGVGSSPDSPVTSLPLIGKKEADSVLRLSRGETLDISDASTYLELFYRQCGENPDKAAVVDSEGSYTYRQLDELSSCVAAYLAGKGLNNKPFAAIRIGRSKDFMVAAIGVHKAGMAYVPIDLDYPEDRVNYMLENSGAEVVLTQELVSEAMQYPGKAEHFVPDAASLAYMIYTSGSTGRPKGVMIRHSSLHAFVRFIRSCWELSEGSRITCHSNFAFDAAVEDLYPVLTVGGTLYIVPEEARKDVLLMRQYIEDNGITGGCYTTQFAQLMSDEEPIKLDYIVLGGEKMTSVPNITGRVINTYGPTEFTVDATWYEIDKTRNYANIPIGRPVYNGTGLILDESSRMLPQGMIGELCLAGPQISAGYHELPEQTEKAFRTVELENGEELSVYHTGDLARYNEEGELEYFGRMDDQIKFRGFRIELDEIVSVASRYEGIRQCAAAIRKEQICLYYTSDKETDEEDLRSFLGQSLADYMVPSAYIRLEAMPLTPNGKVDMKALPDPVAGGGADYVEPEGETELAVAKAFAQVLSSDAPVGAMDNFFAMGGDSIKAIRLVSLLRAENISVNVTDIMKEKTVRGIASSAEGNKGTLISQDPFRGKVTNSAIVNYFYQIHLPVPSYFNQSQMIRCKDRVEPEALQKAWNAVTGQHDMLRAISGQDGLFVRGAENRIPVEEYTASSKKEAEDVCADMESHIEMDKALVRIALIHMPEQDICFIVAHHLVVDGVSWRIILGDLDEAYAQVLSGKAQISLQDKTHTYEDYAKALESYRSSYALEREIPYWSRVQKAMLGMQTSNALDYTRHFTYIDLALDDRETGSILATDMTRWNADINDLILTAVCRSYGQVFGGHALSVQLEGHGREDIGQKLVTDRTVGWFTSIYPVVFEGLTGRVQDDLIVVKEALHSVPNKGVGYNILRCMEGDSTVDLSLENIAAVSFNYLGEMDQKKEDGFFELARDLNAVDAAAENVTDSDLSVNALVMNGQFRLFLSYNDGIYNAQLAKSFAEGILSSMKEVADYVSSAQPVVTASDLGETQWTRTEFDNVVREFESRGEHIERIYPLMPMQEGMLFKHISEPESGAYRLVDIYELDVVPSREVMEKVLERLAAKHEVLRTAIIYEGVQVSRQAITDRRLGLDYVDISGEKDPALKVTQIRQELLAGGFDLQKKPLFHITCAKKSDHGSYLVIACHHIIVDGWCNQLYLGDLFAYLEEELTGRSMPENPAVPAGSYERAVREILAKDHKSGLAYWEKLLEGYTTKAEIPHYSEVPEAERSSSEEETIRIDADLTERFSKLCMEEMSTIGKGTMLAWGLVLQTYSRTNDAVFAKVVSGRDASEQDVNNVLGLFINSVPVRVTVKNESTARSMLRELFRQDEESHAYDFCPLSDIQQRSELGSELFQTVYAFENYNSGDSEEKSLSDLSFTVKPLMIKEEIFDEIIPAAYIDGGQLCMRITYNTKLYRSAEIRRVLDLFETFIREMTEHPDDALCSLTRLNENAAREVIEASYGETMEYDTSRTWIDIFQDFARSDPDHTAVVDSTGSYTYEELDRKSDKFASWLCGQGIGINDFVVIKMNRVKEFVLAMLGIQKAGAAYIPIAPEYPQERISFMIEDSKAKLIVDEQVVADALSSSAPETFASRATNDTLAYMIYTSGSTGLPKGTMIPHRALTNFAHFYRIYTGQNKDSRVIIHTNFAFDASLKDLVPVFTAGGELHVLSEEVRKDLDLVRSYIIDHKITGCNFVTQVAHIITDESVCLPMDYMTMGGEKLVHIPNITGDVFNTYGPTEFTIDALFHKVDKNRSYDDIPIGRPIPNLRCFIVDPNGNLVPKGVRGELCLAGVQIAEGYWQLPEKTAEVFKKLTLPDGETIDVYHTGDLCRMNEEGDVFYCGRIDFQVKFRGFRIELGEIESKAAQFAGVRQTVALIRGDQIVLYYTTSEEVSKDKLVNFLKGTLADYMVPGALVHLDEMPRNQNDKIDRKALPDPELQQDTENVPPATPMEQLYYDIASELLPGVKFGVTDNLPQLGMNSLKAMRFSSQLHQYNARIRVSDIMRFGSIRALIEGSSSITWEYNEFRPGRPALVCVAGIIPLNVLTPKFEALKDRFNIIVIEPASDYYNKFLRTEKFDSVVEFYVDQIDMYTPAKDISVLMGFSWGGVLAAHMAAVIEERWGSRPALLLGDSYFRDHVVDNEEALLKAASAMNGLVPGSLDDFIERHRVINSIGVSSRKLSYAGRCVYLNACKETVHDENDTETMEFKINAAKERLSDIRIIDFEDRTHEDLFTDQSLIPQYVDLLTELAGE